MLSRWRGEALERLPELFGRGASEADKMRKEFEAREDEYKKTIGELTVDLNFLKKNRISIHQSRKERNVEPKAPEMPIKDNVRYYQ